MGTKARQLGDFAAEIRSADNSGVILSSQLHKRDGSFYLDSAKTQNLVNSSYIQSKQITYNTSDFADSAYVTTQIDNLIGGAPGALDTLNELAAAINDDSSYASTVTNSIATKLPLAGGTLTGNLSFGDNVKAQFGASNDLQIYHTGSNSIIKEQGAGNLYLQASNLNITSTTGENYITAIQDSYVALMYDNSTKLQTTSTGIDVTGKVTCDNVLNVNGGTGFGAIEVGGNSGAFIDLKAPFSDDYDARLLYEPTGQSFQFHNAGAEKMRIDSSGNVGIGTSSINANISVYNSSTADDLSLGIFRSQPAGTGESQTLIKILKSSNDTTSAYGGAIGGYLSQGVGSGLTLNTINGGTLSERMRITSAGNVGIGTSSPSAPLHIQKGTGASIAYPSGDWAGKIFNQVDSSTQHGLVVANRWAGSASTAFEVGSLYDNNDGYDTYFRVNGLGQIGINTDSPSGRLHLNGNFRFDGKGSSNGLEWPDEGNGYSIKHYATNHPTAGYSNASQTHWHCLESKGGTHVVLNTDGSRTSGRNNYDHFTVWQKAPDQTNGRACFSVDNGGDAYFANPGLRIDRAWSGYPSITINYESGNGANNSTYGEFRIHGIGGNAGTWWGGGGSPDWSTNLRIDGGTYHSSDRRKKSDINSISNALDKVKQLDGVSFQVLNTTLEPQEHLSKNGYKLGFVAQDIEDVIPEAVKYYPDEDDGTEGYNNAYSVDYGSIVALLTNAIKEQQVTIDNLKTRIETLENK